MNCVVVVAITIGSFPTTMPARAGAPVQAGAEAQVPLKEMTKPEAGDPVPPIVTVIDVSDPATEGEVPQFEEQVGAVCCAVRT